MSPLAAGVIWIASPMARPGGLSRMELMGLNGEKIRSCGHCEADLAIESDLIRKWLRCGPRRASKYSLIQTRHKCCTTLAFWS